MELNISLIGYLFIYFRLIGSFFGFDEPLTCTNAYTVYIRMVTTFVFYLYVISFFSVFNFILIDQRDLNCPDILRRYLSAFK